jgi:capsular exopolysaccharide synthesis family protein
MTAEFGTGLTLRSYARIIRRRKWWVIAFSLLGLAVSLAVSLTEAKQYAASAQVLVQPSSQASALGTTQQPVTTTDVQTMQQLVTSAPVTSVVRHELGNVPPVTAAEVAQTNVIAITAVAATPARAARTANAYADAFVTYQQRAALTSLTQAEEQLRDQIGVIGRQIQQLRRTANTGAQQTALANQQAVLSEQLTQMQVDNVGETGGLTIITTAQPPSSPSSPKPTEDALLGLAAGLILGLAAGFARDGLDDAVVTKEAVEEHAGAPVLAAIPVVQSWKKRDQTLVVSLARPMSPAAEAYRSLRTSLQFAGQERDLRTILVTGPAAAEGKTTTLANLGVTFAQAGQRVVLVSCDLRKPRLGQFFGVDERLGLTTAILGERRVEELLHAAPGASNLWLLASGPLPPNPAELVNGRRIQEVFSALRQMFDLVLIDSPPVLPVTDAVLLAKDADATLLVVAAGRTRRGDLQRAAERLAQVNSRTVGVVLNEISRQTVGYGEYRHAYGAYLSDGPVPRELAELHRNGKAAAHSRGSDGPPGREWPAFPPRAGTRAGSTAERVSDRGTRRRDFH